MPPVYIFIFAFQWFLALKVCCFDIISSDAIHLHILDIEVHGFALRLCSVFSSLNAHIWLQSLYLGTKINDLIFENPVFLI